MLSKVKKNKKNSCSQHLLLQMWCLTITAKSRSWVRSDGSEINSERMKRQIRSETPPPRLNVPVFQNLNSCAGNPDASGGKGFREDGNSLERSPKKQRWRNQQF